MGVRVKAPRIAWGLCLSDTVDDYCPRCYVTKIGMEWNMVERSHSVKIQMLRLKQVIERTGLSRSSIYDRMSPESPRYDPYFPKQIKLGLKSVGWEEAKIQAWLENRVNTERAADELPCGKQQRTTVKSNHNDNYPVGCEVLPEVKISNQQADNLNENRCAETQHFFEKGLNETEFLERKRATVVRNLLEKHGKTGARVLYQQVMDLTMLSVGDPNDRRTIDKILGDITRASFAESGILLGVLVHEKGSSGSIPGDVFFDLVKSLGCTYQDANKFVEQQIIKIYEHFENPANKLTGKLGWIETRGVQKLHRW